VAAGRPGQRNATRIRQSAWLSRVRNTLRNLARPKGGERNLATSTWDRPGSERCYGVLIVDLQGPPWAGGFNPFYSSATSADLVAAAATGSARSVACVRFTPSTAGQIACNTGTIRPASRIRIPLGAPSLSI